MSHGSLKQMPTITGGMSSNRAPAHPPAQAHHPALQKKSNGGGEATMIKILKVNRTTIGGMFNQAHPQAHPPVPLHQALKKSTGGMVDTMIKILKANQTTIGGMFNQAPAHHLAPPVPAAPALKKFTSTGGKIQLMATMS